MESDRLKPSGIANADPQQTAPIKYVYIGQYTQLTDKTSMALYQRLKTDQTMTGDNFKSGQWNIWLRRRGKYIKEIVLMYCGEDITKNLAAKEYDNNKYFWSKPTRMQGFVYIVTDEACMTINTDKIVDLGDICTINNGIIVKKVPKIKYSAVRVTAKGGVITGIKITYNKH